jgi:enoyl-CoA hydratase/carnithine racemase
MPEVTIGLFPDVCSSYFLNKISNNLGMFVGLTGVILNAEDTIYLGLADHKIEHSKKNTLIETLLTLEWSIDRNENDQQLNLLLSNVSENYILENANIKRLEVDIIKAIQADSLEDIIESILAINLEDKWLSRAQQSLMQGSPLAMHLIYQQLMKSKALSKADCFRSELNLMLHCCKMGDFKEGVRALLVEKDKNPKWRYANLTDVKRIEVEKFFEPLWDVINHPLKHL